MPSEATATELRERARVVCTRCHERKVRCDLQSQPSGTCRNCQREGCQCRRHYGVRKRKADTLADRRLLAAAAAADGEGPQPDAAHSVMRAPDPSPGSQTIGSTGSSDPVRYGGYIGDQSLLSYPSDSEAAMYSPANSTLFPAEAERIMQLTSAASLPPPPLAQALADYYFRDLYNVIPVVDRRDLAGPAPSLLLQQSVYFAGSLMRRAKDYYPASSSPRQLYAKIKTLIFLNLETDPLIILKSLCLISSWSNTTPELVSLDCPWQLTGSAVRLALQLGLHRESTYTNDITHGCGRRIWWYLFNIDVLQAACYGRPSMFHLEDFDVKLPTLDDFDTKDIQAQVFCSFTPLCIIISRIERLAPQGQSITSEDIVQQLDNLRLWISQLPEELRLYDKDGLRQTYSRAVAEAYILYFTAIILVYLSQGSHRQSLLLCTASIVASSCMIRLYEEMLYQDSIACLLPIHGWTALVAAVPQVYCNAKFPAFAATCSEEFDICRSVLLQLCEKYPSARIVVSKIDRFRQDAGNLPSIPNGSTGSASRPSSLPPRIQDPDAPFTNVLSLFPFPESISPKMALFKTIDSSVTGFEPEVAPQSYAMEDMNWNFDWSAFSLDNLNAFDGFFNTGVELSL